ncbi:hypothetical protein [Nonomuraea guangzhouensis]|uniref:Uncharacterized protein n=1 Tax=Nonomuraea guangzhouensis TaxID=1291555 RepID=A0ABW4GB40_9ACTN|nr:hypothetical protein [Nonomuraea guangzhouensis]
MAADSRALDQLSAGADLAISALAGIISHTSSGVDEDGAWWRMWLKDPNVGRTASQFPSAGHGLRPPRRPTSLALALRVAYGHSVGPTTHRGR